MTSEVEIEISNNLAKNNELIDKMLEAISIHSACKEALDKEIKEKFFNRFIKVIDRMIDNKNDNDVSLEFKLEDLYEELEDFLQESKLEYFLPKEGDLFDRKQHEARKRIDTDNPDLDGKIEKVMSYGYKLDNVIIKYAKVSVFKYINNTQE